MPHFRKLQEDLIFYASDDVSGDPLTIAKAAINRYYLRVLKTVRADSLRRDDFTLTTVSGTGKYGLPLAVRDVLNIEDPTNQYRIRNVSAKEFDRSLPGRTDAGDPTIYYVLGTYGVQAQPSTAGVLTFVSDTTGDDGNRYCRAMGIDASQNYISEQVTLNGTTDVTGSTSFTKVERIVKSADSGYSIDGNITVKDADGNTLAVIPPWVDSPTYRWVEFYMVPDSANTFNLRTFEQKPPLLYDDDWPDFDEAYHDLLLYGPGSEVLPAFGKPDLGRTFWAKYQTRLKEFRSEYAPRPDAQKVMADVTNCAPMFPRPLIVGYDIGLVS